MPKVNNILNEKYGGSTGIEITRGEHTIRMENLLIELFLDNHYNQISRKDKLNLIKELKRNDPLVLRAYKKYKQMVN